MNNQVFILIKNLFLFGERKIKTGKIPFMAGMVLLTTAILGWLIYRQRDILLSFKWEFRPLPILISFLLYSLSLLEVSLAWSRIMNGLGGKVNFANHFRLFCISNLAKRLPGSVWYIPWRGKMYQNMGISMKLVSVASGIEYAISIISGIICCAVFSIPIMEKFQAGLWLVVVLFVVCLFLLHPNAIRKFGKMLKVDLEEISYKDILHWVFLYVIFWITSGTLLFFVVNILYPVSMDHLAFVMGVWIFTGVLSSSILLLPSNFGLTEISISLLLSIIIPSSVAVISAIGTRIILFLYELLWATSMLLWEYLSKRT